MRFIASLVGLASLTVAGAQDLRVTGSTGPLQDELSRLGAPGLAVAVVHGEQVIDLRGSGSASIESGGPVAPETLFQIGSATKMLTATAVMSAHAAKALDVDAPVSRYVSGLTTCVGAPTVRQLLSHTGGLIDEPDEFGPQGEEGLAAYPRT